MAIRQKGGAVLALANGFSLYDFKTQRLATHIGDPEFDEPENRLNDGKGRLTVAAASLPATCPTIMIAKTPRGQRPVRNLESDSLAPDLTITRLDSGIK